MLSVRTPPPPPPPPHFHPLYFQENLSFPHLPTAEVREGGVFGGPEPSVPWSLGRPFGGRCSPFFPSPPFPQWLEKRVPMNRSFTLSLFCGVDRSAGKTDDPPPLPHPSPGLFLPRRRPFPVQQKTFRPATGRFVAVNSLPPHQSYRAVFFSDIRRLGVSCRFLIDGIGLRFLETCISLFILLVVVFLLFSSPCTALPPELT